MYGKTDHVTLSGCSLWLLSSAIEPLRNQERCLSIHGALQVGGFCFLPSFYSPMKRKLSKLITSFVVKVWPASRLSHFNLPQSLEEFSPLNHRNDTGVGKANGRQGCKKETVMINQESVAPVPATGFAQRSPKTF